ncbi:MULTISPECIES: gas vesicle protein GvpL [unclassified Haladaptatus]|uniref:gas vesicle protein GvpL n=1 Tax=unclassified Haladaptatus TaxID=2622732 RepID=UPI0023E830AA|nr:MULTISPECIES: GvpL/GvpF family gas vesicle protein [unclassified Haladaptatus]
MTADRRYVFCAVSVADGPDTYRTVGLDGTDAYLVREGAVGALVQPQDAAFERDDDEAVQRLLVDHLAIVDEVGETFGTPLPLRFNTVFEGGDDGVREWLRDDSEQIATQLDQLAGHWEYRIEVVWTDDRPATDENDDRLAELDAKLEDAAPGKRFLLEKQRDQRVAELARERKAAVQDDLESRVAPHAKAVAALDDQSLEIGGQETEGEVVARVSVLATDEGASAIGDLLDEVAAEEGVEVRYTGPWPPYTHVSEGVPE